MYTEPFLQAHTTVGDQVGDFNSRWIYKPATPIKLELVMMLFVEFSYVISNTYAERILYLFSALQYLPVDYIMTF